MSWPCSATTPLRYRESTVRPVANSDRVRDQGSRSRDWSTHVLPDQCLGCYPRLASLVPQLIVVVVVSCGHLLDTNISQQVSSLSKSPSRPALTDAASRPAVWSGPASLPSTLPVSDDQSLAGLAHPGPASGRAVAASLPALVVSTALHPTSNGSCPRCFPYCLY